ncbi:MAG: ATP-binding protein, partial [Actinomycetota bacterium]
MREAPALTLTVDLEPHAGIAVTVDDVRLLVTELVSNSVRHADLADGEGIRLRVTTSDHVVRVEVMDHGRGFEPRDRDAPLTQASGW